MAKENGVADLELPGEVLKPNAASSQDPFGSTTGLEQFGTELENPNKIAPSMNPDAVRFPGDKKQEPQPNADEQKRFEYWQSEAQKAQAKAKEIEAQLAKVTPLVEFVSKDEDSYRYIQNRLNGNRTPDKPLEPPQKPESYNEVEAFSNPESASFKYRKDNDVYKDKLLQSVIKQHESLFQQRQQEAQAQEIQRIEREKMVKFQQEVIAEGVQPEEFPEFWNTVRNADHKTMVKFFKWQKAQAQSPDNESVRFDVPLTSSAGGTGRSKPLDMGDIFVEASRRMM
jgi:hypothetical protein